VASLGVSDDLVVPVILLGDERLKGGALVSEDVSEEEERRRGQDWSFDEKRASRRWDEPLEPVGSSLLGLVSDVLASLDGEDLKEKERMERKSVDARRVEEGLR